LGGKYKHFNLSNVKEGDYVIFQFNNALFIRRIYNGNRLSIPTRFIRRNNLLNILKILRRPYFKKSKNKSINYNGREFVDLKFFLPNKIKVFEGNVELLVQEFPINKLLISYDLPGRKGKILRPFIIHRYIPLNLFVQFLGF